MKENRCKQTSSHKKHTLGLQRGKWVGPAQEDIQGGHLGNMYHIPNHPTPEPLAQVQTLRPDFPKAQYLENCSQAPVQRALSREEGKQEKSRVAVSISTLMWMKIRPESPQPRNFDRSSISPSLKLLTDCSGPREGGCQTAGTVPTAGPPDKNTGQQQRVENPKAGERRL